MTTTIRCQAENPSTCRYHGSPFTTRDSKIILEDLNNTKATMQETLKSLESLTPEQQETKTAIKVEAQIMDQKLKIFALETEYFMTDEGYKHLEQRVEGYKHHPASDPQKYEEEKRKFEQIGDLRSIQYLLAKDFAEQREDIRSNKNSSKEEKEQQLAQVERKLLHRILDSERTARSSTTDKVGKGSTPISEFIDHLNRVKFTHELLLKQAKEKFNTAS